MASRNSNKSKWSVLQIFGLAIVAGDGPLTVAYIATQDCVVRNAMIGFIFMMGVVFCGIAIFKPENFYHPQDFPPNTISNKTGIVNSKPVIGNAVKSLQKKQPKKRLKNSGIENPSIKNL